MPLIAMFVKAEMEAGKSQKPLGSEGCAAHAPCQGVERLVFPDDETWKLDVQQSGGTAPWHFHTLRRMGNTLCYVVTTLLKETRQGVTIDPTNEDTRNHYSAQQLNHRLATGSFVCQEEIPNSKGTANFLIKWEGAKVGVCKNMPRGT